MDLRKSVVEYVIQAQKKLIATEHVRIVFSSPPRNM